MRERRSFGEVRAALPRAGSTDTVGDRRSTRCAHFQRKRKGQPSGSRPLKSRVRAPGSERVVMPPKRTEQY